MHKLTKYQSKMKRMVVKAITATCVFGMFYIPFSVSPSAGTGYYKVVLNGQELGAVNSIEEANEALFNARKMLASNSDSVLYIDPDFQVSEVSRIVGSRASVSEMSDLIYNNLSSSVVNVAERNAYTIRINDFTITLGSKEEVIELIERAKNDFDKNNEFQVAMLDNGSTDAYSIELSKSGFAGKENSLVAASANGTVAKPEEVETKDELGINALAFNKNISVVPTKATPANIVSVEQAYNEITKKTAAKTYYTIVPGDSLYLIAQKNGLTLNELYALNEGLHENSFLGIGDQLIITVPTPEVSVVVTERVKGEEEYDAEVEYIENNDLYRGESSVIREGVPGRRIITADVNYIDGIEQSRTTIDEQIITEAVPEVIEIGTLTPPTFVKPLYGGIFTSEFGYRWGTTHTGVDWFCGVGTPVFASCDGTVIRASWYSTYGNCVDIQHSNGVVTRYAHLNEISVSVGQYVDQYQTIGYSGETGWVTGPHVHFEYIIGGTAVNPLNYVNKY